MYVNKCVHLDEKKTQYLYFILVLFCGILLRVEHKVCLFYAGLTIDLIKKKSFKKDILGIQEDFVGGIPLVLDGRHAATAIGFMSP